MHPLEKMFRPRSVAVVGASGDPEKLGGRTLFHIKELGYRGRIFPINVSGKEVQGLPSWTSIAELPETPDSAIIVLPAKLVERALEDCAAKGILHVQVLSSGFAEEGGEGIAMQRRIVEVLRRTGMRITGPNCLGSISPPDGYFGTFSTCRSQAAARRGGAGEAERRLRLAHHCLAGFRASASAVPSPPATRPISTSRRPSTTSRWIPAQVICASLEAATLARGGAARCSRRRRTQPVIVM